MGLVHAKYLAGGEVPGAELVAVCDTNSENLSRAADSLGEGVQLFDETGKLFASGAADAVIVATPHYFHPELAVAAFEADLHVLIEKPAGVYTKQVRQMNEAAAESGKVFGIMFNRRTWPIYRKLRDLVSAGELGALKRTGWIATAWYRPQSYYDSCQWRATWKGEGGGVLINQCVHQLDVWQWVCGMPNRVRAACGFGRYHDIEVEDDVTAMVEYPGRATGTFITSTGEAPGTDRLEIAGDNGKIVMAGEKLTFRRTVVPEPRFNREFDGGFGEPESWEYEVPVPGPKDEHKTITCNWVNAITCGAELIAPGEEGIKSLELVNAMLLSAWTDRWVDLPIDEDLYYQTLQEKIRTSKVVKKAPAKTKVMDVTKTF